MKGNDSRAGYARLKRVVRRVWPRKKSSWLRVPRVITPKPKIPPLESSGYIFVFTTLPASALSAAQALELYRGRWQIELVFKRLKSILSLGYLRKVDPDSARSWLEGKLFVAMLIEALLAQTESFFPWGYPLEKNAVHAVNGGNSVCCFTSSSRALIRA